MNATNRQLAVTGPRYWDEIVLDFPGDPMTVVIGSDGESLVGLRFGAASEHVTWLGSAARRTDDAILSAAAEQLRAYATGHRRAFDLPVRTAGSAFRKEVWDELLAVPYGTTISYGAMAARLGRTGQAARAVGAAVGANPVGIVIPCHRVIGADGSLTGFAGGLDRKVVLLAREGVTAR